MLRAPKNDWYLRAWMTALDIRFPHAWLQKELGYSDGKASNVLNGKKRYDRDLINEIADALKIQPHELLMHPSQAMALRQQLAAAMTLANSPPADPEAAEKLASAKRRA